MKPTLRIDFISDISCAWCAVGLHSLEKALGKFPEVTPQFRLHPFELSPDVSAQGENLLEHIQQKYDVSVEEARESFDQLTQRGAEVGFRFNFTGDSRVYNTFEAHRLLFWAAQKGPDLDLEKALFKAYFTDGLNPGDHAVLTRLAGEAGLDANEAREVLHSGAFRQEVADELAHWRDKGVSVVPTIIFQERLTIPCAQTVTVFEQYIQAALLKDIASGPALM